MPSTVTNLTQYFIESATTALDYRLGNVDKVARIVEKQGAIVNDYTRIPYISSSAQPVQTFSHTTGYVNPDSRVEGIDLQFTDWLYRPFEITDTEAVRLSPADIANLARANANLLANDIYKKLFTATTSSFANSIQAGGSAWASTAGIIALSTSASLQRWDEGDKNLVVTPSLYWRMAGNTTTLVANALGKSDVVQKGVLSDYYGWKPFIVDSLPTTVQGMGLTSQAMALGVSIPTPQANGQIEGLAVISLPNGMKIQAFHYYTPSLRKHTFVNELITGYAVIDRTRGYNLVVNNMAA
jgi:hypothetical protein